LFHSKVLIADGLHSLVDLSTDMAVLLGLKFAAIPSDRNHPYGHHKLASFAHLVISVMIFAFSLSLIWSAAVSFHEPSTVSPGAWALVVALLSLVVKEILFFMTIRVGKRLRSRLLMANAWHHRTDSISSVLTAVTIGITLILGPDWLFLDSFMAAALGLFLAFEGGKLLFQAINDLVDRAPNTDLIDDLREHILPTTGVVGYHQFRARRIGDMVEVDMHLQVDPKLTVDAGHLIAREVRQNMMHKHPEIFDVLIHIEPANNETLDATKGLADIQELER